MRLISRKCSLEISHDRKIVVIAEGYRVRFQGDVRFEYTEEERKLSWEPRGGKRECIYIRRGIRLHLFRT